MTYNFFVFGIPMAQPRARARAITFKNSSGQDIATARMYEADKSAPIRLWKATVRLAAIEAGVKPITGPVKVDLFFSFPRPKSLMRKKDSADFIWHTKKPDRDNLDKAVLDALKGVAWTDDCQVCAGVIEKTYPAKGDARIGVEIYIGECEQ